MAISGRLKRDHRTIKRFVANSEHIRFGVDEGRMTKVSDRQIHGIERAAAKIPSQSSKHRG